MSGLVDEIPRAFWNVVVEGALRPREFNIAMQDAVACDVLKAMDGYMDLVKRVS